MPSISNGDAFEVLCLQAAGDGRGEVLFGESFARARTALRPFVNVRDFPDVYLEFPLVGDPFLDVTVLYGPLERGVQIASEAAAGTEAMLDWFAQVREERGGINCGFELDTKSAELPAAAIHFQPRQNQDLVEPFCVAVGEPEQAQRYLDLARRMPQGWPLSFFGMFRGRPGSPLRVCGYLDRTTVEGCAVDTRAAARVFDEIGFTAYDDAMLAQVGELMGRAPGTVDFQFDVYPDGTMGDTFALDVQFGIERPEAVRENFASGTSGQVMRLLEEWGAADERWHLGAEAAFAMGLPMMRDDGSAGLYSFTLMPQWVKARWRGGVLQPSKLYLLGNAGFLDEKRDDEPAE